MKEHLKIEAKKVTEQNMKELRFSFESEPFWTSMDLFLKLRTKHHELKIDIISREKFG